MADTRQNAVTAGLGSDIRAAAVGAMMPFGLGLLVLVGYAWIGVFGGILGLLGAVWWAFWWRRRHNKKFFPRDVEGGPFVLTLVLTVILFIAALASI